MGRIAVHAHRVADGDGVADGLELRQQFLGLRRRPEHPPLILEASSKPGSAEAVMFGGLARPPERLPDMGKCR